MLWSCFVRSGKWYSMGLLLVFSLSLSAFAESEKAGSGVGTAAKKKAIETLLLQLAEYDANEKVFVSSPDALPFHLETMVHSPESDQLQGLFVSEAIEWDRQNASYIVRGDRLGVRNVLLNSLAFRLLGKDKWHVKPGAKWSIKRDGVFNNPFLLVHGGSLLAQIQIKPFEFEHSRVSVNGGLLTYTFQKTRKGIHFELNNGKGGLWFILRTPSDQLRYGYPLEAILMSEEKISIKNGEKYELRYCLNSFAVGDNLCPLMRHLKKLQQYEKLLPQKLFIKDQNWRDKKYVSQLSTDEQLSCSDQLYHLFNGVDLQFAIENSTNEEIKKTAQQIQELMLFGKEYLDEKKGSHVVSKEKYDQNFDVVIEILKNLSLQSSMQGEKRLIAVKDQFMRWKYLESIYGPTTISEFYDLIVTIFAMNEDLEVDRKILFSGAIANLGFPRHTGNGGEIMKFRRSNLLYDIIFRPHWAIVGWAKVHLDACLKFDRFASRLPAINNIAVETLIRMDETDQIKPANLESWFQSEIALVSGRKRIMNLSILTLQPSGRSYLLKQLEEGIADQSLRSDIVRHLGTRVDATNKTKRYDFMSQAECNQIKKVIGEGL